MADINNPSLTLGRAHHHTWGNAARDHKGFSITAAANDVVRFARIPAGNRLTDIQVMHAAGGASRTMKFGYLPVDGSAGDDDFFMAAKDISAVGRLRADRELAPVVLAKDSYIVGTLEGGALAGIQIDVVTEYETVGHP